MLDRLITMFDDKEISVIVICVKYSVLAFIITIFVSLNAVSEIKSDDKSVL